MSSINDIKYLYTQIKVSETEGTLLSEASFDIGPGHKGAQKTQKLYNKGSKTDNPYEKEQFLKRTGPQLPLAKAKPGMQVAGYEPEGDIVDEAQYNPQSILQYMKLWGGKINNRERIEELLPRIGEHGLRWPRPRPRQCGAIIKHCCCKIKLSNVSVCARCSSYYDLTLLIIRYYS